jgi:hypothetical protein
VFADLLNVRNQIPRGVLFERGVGRTLAAPALIEVHDAVLARIEETALLRVRTSARTAVEKDHRLSVRVSAFFEVQVVDV